MPKTKPTNATALADSAKTSTKTPKDVQKLQRSIVDGLEDLKAQNILVFDTTELSSLFERVFTASGTSNRQTKAIAASVRDAVREAGFEKPRSEGEENGEWIIVDCGAAVVHIMQPAIRQYYQLEDIWGEKPIRLKFGAAKPVVAKATKPKTSEKVSSTEKPKQAAGKKTTKTVKEPATKAAMKTAAVKKTAVKKVAAKKVATKAPTKAPTKTPAKATNKAASVKSV